MYYKVILFFSLSFSLIACDQFSRFRQEKYECGNNLSGLEEVIINKAKVGNEIKLNFNNISAKTNIKDISSKRIFFSYENKLITINREDGSTTVKEGNKIIVIKCKKLVFKM